MAAAVLEAMRQVKRNAQWSDDLHLCHRQLIESDDPSQAVAWRARLPGECEADRLFDALILISAVPEMCRRYLERAIDQHVARATLADMPRWMRHYYALFGNQWGFDRGPFMWRHLTARLFQLGRLAFEIATNPLSHTRVPLGSRVLAVHIPASGPLDDEACDASFTEARRFFAQYFSNCRFSGFICESWLLDRQLAEYLPADSNIMRFQRRFELVSAVNGHDNQIIERAFNFRYEHLDPTMLKRVSCTTSLQKIVVDHIRRGRTWKMGAGVIPW
jgi:hypothetical protein